MTLCLRARTVLPLIEPPIEDGGVCVNGDRISWCGSWKARPAVPDERIIDLGERILLPGLINAHCHLDYTSLAGLLPAPRSFTDWIKGLVALKASCNTLEFAGSWQRGAGMLLRTGTTTVADVEAMPELLPAIWNSTPLRVISFRELIHLKHGPPARELVARAAAELDALPANPGRVALSPHATYSTTSDLLEAAAAQAQQRRWRLMTHVSESAEEFEMFMYRQGPMFDWLKSQREMSDCGLGSPIQHLDRIGYLGENLTAVHVNHLWRHDAGLLGRNKVSVVHCPRSHAYFQHLKFPREELERAGVNICLGTDSLASMRRTGTEEIGLDMFAEMRALLETSPRLAPESIVRMATLNASRALGRADELGWLGPGALADLIAVPFAGTGRTPFEAVIHHRGPVSASMIAGRWAIDPGSK
ncbi:MAG TPA: amidohydrolase family protein [Verrucomicrobiae bacterium]|nr:amidohydrolase family protein [Verrucomicrobiae bacterium]